MRTGTRQEREVDILKTLEIAGNHRANSNARMESFCLNSACRALVRISVDEFSQPQDAITYLKINNLPEYLERFVLLNNDIYENFKSIPKHPFTQVSTDIDIVHFAWLMEMDDEANLMLSISTDEEVWRYKPVVRIWKDYHRMVGAFVNGGTYEPNPPKLKGYEKHWLPYIYLMGNFTKSEDTAETIKLIDESFSKRNQDRRLQNYPSFDGDGAHPVKWDLRRYTILEFGAKHYRRS